MKVLMIILSMLSSSSVFAGDYKSLFMGENQHISACKQGGGSWNGSECVHAGVQQLKFKKRGKGRKWMKKGKCWKFARKAARMKLKGNPKITFAYPKLASRYAKCRVKYGRPPKDFDQVVQNHIMKLQSAGAAPASFGGPTYEQKMQMLQQQQYQQQQPQEVDMRLKGARAL